MWLTQPKVSIIDWCVVGLSGGTALMFFAGAIYAGRYRDGASRHAGASFNYLWSARVFLQVAAASYALAQILRLQVLWGPQSVFLAPNTAPQWLATAMCRVYLAVLYGLCEPVSMLLALFACVYSAQSKLSPPIITGARVWETEPLAGGTGGGSGGDSGGGAAGSGKSSGAVGAPVAPRPGSIRHPNFNIVFFAIGFTLPACTAQLVCALFTRIFDLDFQNVALFRIMFAAYDQREVQYCPSNTPDPATGCAWCVFPVLSTLISGGFLLAFLLAFWVVTSRITTAVISKLLIKRIRMLQILVTVSMVGSIGCRAATVLFMPFELGFELLRLAHVLFWGIALLSMSHLLVWRPVRDSKIADKHLEQFKRNGELSFPLRAVGFGWDGSNQGDDDRDSGAAAATGKGGAGAAAAAGGRFWQSPSAASVAANGSTSVGADDMVVGSNPILSLRAVNGASVGAVGGPVDGSVGVGVGVGTQGVLRKGSTPSVSAGMGGAGLAASSMGAASVVSGISLSAGVAGSDPSGVGPSPGPGSISTQGPTHTGPGSISQGAGLWTLGNRTYQTPSAGAGSQGPSGPSQGPQRRPSNASLASLSNELVPARAERQPLVSDARR